MSTENLPGPASILQQRLCTLQRRFGVNPHFTYTACFEVRGPLDLGRLDRAVLATMQRHSAMRTVLRDEDGRIVQEPTEPPPTSLIEVRPDDENEPLDQRLARFFGHQLAFDIFVGPVFGVTFQKLAPDHHALSFQGHYAFFDYGSFDILFDELEFLYGAPDSAQELPARGQYVDFARAECRRLDAGGLAKNREYWQHELGGATKLAFLGSPERPGERRVAQWVGPASTFSEFEWGQIEAAAAVERASTPMVLLAAGALLGRVWSSQDDIIVSHIIDLRTAGRLRQEFFRTIGHFGTGVPIRLRVSEQTELVALLPEIRRKVFQGMNHADVDWPFLFPDTGVVPASIMVNYVGAGYPTLSLPGIEVRRVPDGPVLGTDLALMFTPERGGVVLTLDYNAAVFERATIAQMAEQYRSLLDRFVQHSRMSDR